LLFGVLGGQQARQEKKEGRQKTGAARSARHGCFFRVLGLKQASYERSEREGVGLGSRRSTAALFSPRKRSVPLSVAAWRPTLVSNRSEEELFGVNRTHFFQRVLVSAEETESLRLSIVV